jgi:predicted GNAT family acetyltransferase
MSEVRNNEAESRFELEEDGALAYASYDLSDGAIAFTHTIVPKEVEGRGIGSRLIRAALEDARERGLKVVPLCSFVRGYIERHPEVQDLVG